CSRWRRRSGSPGSAGSRGRWAWPLLLLRAAAGQDQVPIGVNAGLTTTGNTGGAVALHHDRGTTEALAGPERRALEHGDAPPDTLQEDARPAARSRGAHGFRLARKPRLRALAGDHQAQIDDLHGRLTVGVIVHLLVSAVERLGDRRDVSVFDMRSLEHGFDL